MDVDRPSSSQAPPKAPAAAPELDEAGITNQRAIGKGMSSVLSLLSETGSLKEKVEWAGRTNDRKKNMLQGLDDVYSGGRAHSMNGFESKIKGPLSSGGQRSVLGAAFRALDHQLLPPTRHAGCLIEHCRRWAFGRTPVPPSCRRLGLFAEAVISKSYCALCSCSSGDDDGIFAVLQAARPRTSLPATSRWR